jgi:hypothetical protein
MTHVGIHVEFLAKLYRIGGRARYITMRDWFANELKSPARWFSSDVAGKSDPGARYIWMLRKDSFLPRRSGEKRGPRYERG